MLDPYLVLGVGKYDDDQTVKKAYRQLSKQYHPDNNINNPNKEAAEETFKKIQQAYEQIMHERSLGIGGPDDLRRKTQENRSSSQSTSSSGYGQWGSTRTAEKERETSGFWNRSTFDENKSGTSSSSNNNYGGYYSGSTGYDRNGNSGESYGYGNNGNSGYGNNNGYSGNSGGYYSSGYNNEYRTGSRTGRSSFSYGGNPGNVYQSENSDEMLEKVAAKLNNRNFFDAWDLLNSMQSRNDVWYYYSAIANLGLGNTITAINHAKTAKSIVPRYEYDELINGIQNGTMHYQGRADMFVPQNTNAKNTCVKVGLAMLFVNIFCSGGSLMFNNFICRC